MLIDRANHYIAGGVVSLNRKVQPHIVFREAEGCHLRDVEGKQYIDYHAAFAPYLLGHNDPDVNRAVQHVFEQRASLYGSGTNSLEIDLAQLLTEVIPSVDLVQLTNTGSEATAHAIRLSRAWTKREDIILIMGGYNGWHNEVARAVMPSLDVVGPRIEGGEYPFIPMSSGIPESTKKKVHIVNYNDLESVEFVLKKYPIACVMTEPVLQNIGVVKPGEGYLQGLIDLCERYGAVCIFDEVKTGFRTSIGGYQGLKGLKPHLSVFGKAISNGFPLGVIGGREDIMLQFDHPDPHQKVLIAGTYNGHPVNVAAGIATINKLKKPGTYEKITDTSHKLYEGLADLLNEKGVPYVLVNNASAYCIYFCEKAPRDLHDILIDHDFEIDMKLRKGLITEGIYHIPIACKQGSISYSHTEKDIDQTLDKTEKVLKRI